MKKILVFVLFLYSLLFLYENIEIQLLGQKISGPMVSDMAVERVMDDVISESAPETNLDPSPVDAKNIQDPSKFEISKQIRKMIVFPILMPVEPKIAIKFYGNKFSSTIQLDEYGWSGKIGILHFMTFNGSSVYRKMTKLCQRPDNPWTHSFSHYSK